MAGAVALIATFSLGIIPVTALADETDDSLAGLTDEELAQLDDQLGIMPLNECAESSTNTLAAADMFHNYGTRPNSFDPSRSTVTKGWTGANSGVNGGVYCSNTRVGITQGSTGVNGKGRYSWAFYPREDYWLEAQVGQAWDGHDPDWIFGLASAFQVSKSKMCTVTVDYDSTRRPHTYQTVDCGVGTVVDTRNLPQPSDGKGFYTMSLIWHDTDPTPGDGHGSALPDPEPGEPDPVYYTLSYNKNASDATGSMSSQRVEEDTYATVKSNGFNRPGYTFQGWATSPSGSVTYDPGDSIYMSGNRTLYAVWKKDTVYYTLSYDKNASDATGSMSGTRVEAGKSTSVKQNGFNRPGYDFTGWNTSSNGNGTSYAPSDTITLNSNTTIYAQWTPANVQVNYDPNGGEGSHDPTEGKANQDVTIPDDLNDPFHRDHYELTGWNTKSDGSGDSYAPGDTIHMGTSDQTLYAQWKRIPVQVNYNPNGGEGSHDPTAGDAGDPITIPDDLNDPFTKPGSILTGWNTEPDGSGDSYQPGDDISMDDEDKTLYAQWKELNSVLPSTGGDGVDIPMLPVLVGGLMLIVASVVGVVFLRRSRG